MGIWLFLERSPLTQQLVHAEQVRYFLYEFLRTYVEIPCYDRGICATLVARGVARNELARVKFNPTLQDTSVAKI
jgi:hypothetical protein